VWGNGENLVGCSATYSDIGTATVDPGSHNISADPSFVSSATGDYRLNGGSPCIDAGTDTATTIPASATDKDGVSRPQGAAYDMGAYESRRVRIHYAVDNAAHGSIDGSSTQFLDYGSDSTTVTAKPARGYHFLAWSDGKKLPARLDSNVTAGIDATATFSADTNAPMWRFYNKRMGTHLYTADSAERDNVTATLSAEYNFEGIAWQVSADNPDNGAPLYRFRNRHNGSYLYTADTAERDAITSLLSSTWVLEGVASHVCADSAADGVSTVWRFRNRRTGAYFYTADASEKASVEKASGTWTLEGEAFYLAP